MSSCVFHPMRPALATVEGKLLCARCERDWHRRGYFALETLSPTPTTGA